MGKLNINILLCEEILEKGSTLKGIFDTIVCDPDFKVKFGISILYCYFSEENKPGRYILKTVMRYVTNSLGQERGDYQIINTFEIPPNRDKTKPQNTKQATYMSNAEKTIDSGRHTINLSTKVLGEGTYQIEILGKYCETKEDEEKFAKIKDKDLEQLAVQSFEVIMKE